MPSILHLQITTEKSADLFYINIRKETFDRTIYHCYNVFGIVTEMLQNVTIYNAQQMAICRQSR